MQKFFVVLGAALFQKELIVTAKKRGYKTLVFDKNPQAIGAREADIFFTIDISDIKSITEALEPYKQYLKLCATVGTDFSHVVASINEKFHLPGPRPAHSELTTHKGKMRQFFAKYNLPQPKYICTSKEEEAYEWAKENPAKDGYVIKPAQNMGARGVLFLKEIEQLAYAFEYAAYYDKKKEVILEHYIPAHEFSVDALVYHGQVFITGIADRQIILKDGHYFIEMGHLMPSIFYQQVQVPIQKLMQGVANALCREGGTYHGALKGDLRWDKSGNWYIGEIASRLSGGFMSTHTYPLASGNDLLGGFIDLLEGRLPEFIEKKLHEKYNQFCLEKAVVSQAGELYELNIPPFLQNNPNFQIFSNFQVGDVILDLKSNVGKVANIIVVGQSSEEAFLLASELEKEIQIKTGPLKKSTVEIERVARKKFNPKYCWVCKVCDGVHCASSVPGMGGRGNGAAFRDNLYALAEYIITPNYLSEATVETAEPNITLELFGKTFNAPLLTAPITGSVTNLGGSITEWEYAIETGAACKRLNLLPLFGDGASPNKYRVGLYALETLNTGCPVFKPRADQKELIKRIQEAEKKGAIAWGMDIDGISFKTLELKNVRTNRKSLAEIKELAQSSSLPFFLKGILSLQDAELACEAKASAIIVSNHGGRVMESAPGSARVLPKISAFVRKNYPGVKILADGGIRSGGDIFKMLALGADAVLVGRPVAIYTVAYGRVGVEALFCRYLEEFVQILKLCGIKNLSEITDKYLDRTQIANRV